MAYKDSYVVIFHGPRRGGKTLSMVVQAVIDMISGRKVFSNFLIRFRYHGVNYESLPLNYYSLLAQDEQYKDSCICWDETALWATARDSGAVFNKILGLALTLIGKWEANLYSSVQFLNLVDKNLRQQADAHVFCNDLSFKYQNLERGSHIGQLLLDISGRFTGNMFEYTKETYQRTLRGKDFWLCYDTKRTFDIMQAKQKVKLNAGIINIGVNGVEGVFSNEDNYSRDEENILRLKHLIAGYKAIERPVVPSKEFIEEAMNSGFVGTTTALGSCLSELNVNRKYAGGRIRYDFSTVDVD